MTKIAKTIAKTNGQSQELALSESVVPAWVVSSRRPRARPGLASRQEAAVRSDVSPLLAVSSCSKTLMSLFATDKRRSGCRLVLGCSSRAAVKRYHVCADL